MNAPNIIRESLTKKEMEILECIAQNLSNKEMAEKFCISEETIHSHRKNINKKIDVNSIYLLAYQILKDKNYKE